MQIAIIYEECNIIDKYVPMLITAFNELGHEINLIKNFPKQAGFYGEPDEINEFVFAFDENLIAKGYKKGRDFLILHDRGCFTYLGNALLPFLQETVLLTFLQDKYRYAMSYLQDYHPESSLAVFEELFPWIVKKILNFHEPKIIYVVSYAIYCHWPFKHLTGKEKNKENSYGLIVKLLSEAGFPEDRIIFKQNFQEVPDQENTWIIQDEDERDYDKYTWRNNEHSIVLKLPLPSFCQSAFRNCLIECEKISSKALVKALKFLH